MKRLATLLLAAGLVFGASQAAQAIEFKGSGIFEAYFGWSNAHNGNAFPDNGAADSYDRFRPSQRVRLKLEMIASENLRAVFQIENNILWGSQDSGGQLGGDGVEVQVKHAYLDWVIPTTDVQVRIGLQPVILPGMVAGSAILDDDLTGIVISKAFNENVAATLFWLRPYANNNLVDPNVPSDGYLGHDAVDLFGMTLPLTFDGFNVTPWAMYGQSGKDQDGPAGSANIAYLSNADIWYAGITAELIAFDPFRFAIDFNYGAVDTDDNVGLSDDTSGYVLSAIAEYKLDMMTPGLLLWYASGNDNDKNGDGGVMPVLAASWQGTSFGFADYYGAGNGSTEVFGASPVGTWGAALQAKDISFMEDMTHLFRVAYYTGTSEQDATTQTWDIGNIMTDDDNALEVNFNTTYAIYENLDFVLELAYLSMDWDDDIANGWGPDKRDDAYRVHASFGYSF